MREGGDLAPIRTSYFQRVRNVGDAIAPLVLGHVARRPTILARSTELPYLLSVGSLLQTATPQSFIWGTGLIHPSAGVGEPAAERIVALRGKLTHAELRRRGIPVGDVPLGDPGVLVPQIFRPAAAGPPPFRLGLVPHVFDRDHPFFLAAAAHPDVKVLDVCAAPDTFFAELTSCAAIASSSLHGLIFGEAYGLPTLWLRVSDKVIGGGFKFADWFSLARNPQRDPHEPRTFVSATQIADRCEPRGVEIDKNALALALTAEVLEACSWWPQPQRPTVSVAECRSQPLPVFVASAPRGALRSALSSPWRGHPSATIVGCGSDENAVGGDGSDRVNEALESFFRDWQEPSRFAVAARADDLSTLARGSLDAYDDLLDRFPRVDSVGPAEEVPVQCRCGIVEGNLDVGFALYRAGTTLGPAMRSFRVCAQHRAHAH